VSTNIALAFQTNYDLALLSAGLKVRLVRLLATVRFKTAGGWTAPYEAIVDTGNPITIIPQNLHQQISSQVLYPRKVDLLGYEDGLTELRMISDYPQQQACFEIP